MNTPDTIHALVALWPTRKDLAVDLGVPVDRVQKWPQVGSIPSKYHQAIIDAGVARGFPLSAKLIVRLHASPVADAERAVA